MPVQEVVLLIGILFSAGACTSAAQAGLNPCLDPTTDAFVCEPASNRIDLEGCGVTQADANDLAACLQVARKAGVTKLSFGDTSDDVKLDGTLDEELFAMLDRPAITDEDLPRTASGLGTDERLLIGAEGPAPTDTFFELASGRFKHRQAETASGPDEEEEFSFKHLQLIRVPKAGSSEASIIARILGGCKPRGSCCHRPAKASNCLGPGHGCETVTGCFSHNMRGPEKLALEVAAIFTMSHLRDVVERIVSAFLYGSMHAPECAEKENVDYEECFLEMVRHPRYQNVASRLFSGHDAYGGKVRLCLEEDSEDCTETLTSVLAGACHVNIILVTEVWQSSILLLFETLPWVRPTLEFFPVVHPQPDAERSTGSEEGPSLETEEYVVARRNVDAKHNEGIKHITAEMRGAASRLNPVDIALHEFVSAKFCDRLRETGLLYHPLVATELGAYESLHQRCTDHHWVQSTLEHFRPLVPEDCRLYRPFIRQ